MTRHCWLGDSPYNCPDCDGGTYTCECGSECECEECRGSGWDSSLVDVDSFLAAEKALCDKMRAAGSFVLTHEWVDELGRRLGRDGGKFGRVAVKDFLLAAETKGTDP